MDNEFIFEKINRPGDKNTWSPGHIDPEQRNPKRVGATAFHRPSGSYARSTSCESFEENALVAERKAKETMDYKKWERTQVDDEPKYDLINGLTESRVFRSKHRLSNLSYGYIRDVTYLSLIALSVLYQEDETRAWAKSYASRTAAFQNFDHFRTAATDLYLGMYALKEIHDKDPSTLWTFRTMRAIGQGQADLSLIRRYLIKIESTLGVSDGLHKSIRRGVLFWDSKTSSQKLDLLNKMKLELRSRSPWADTLPQLRKVKMDLQTKIKTESKDEDDPLMDQYKEL